MTQNKFKLSLFNTETRRKEELVPQKEGVVTLYTCGPTVYNFAHIGNLRTYTFEDLLRRTVQFLGYRIIQVMNLTDVDDKTIKGAIEKNVSLEAYTKPYIDAFFEDLKALHIQPAEHYPAATQYIQAMISMIEDLLKKGVAYRGADGSIYFAIRKFPRYGCLSHFKLDELQAGASERVSSDEYEKENASDFVLWKHYDSTRDGNIFWESPFGPGRPGWHLECSTMAIQLLGQTVDIHVGGVDNMFPHHENEIAQSECFSGRRFVNMWLHAEHLVVDGKKMSKSLKNFYTLRDLQTKGYTGTQVRYLLMQTHYKTQLNFTYAGLDAAKHSLQRLQDFARRMKELIGYGPETSEGKVTHLLAQAEEAFTAHLADDLNISPALAALFELIRELNGLADQGQVSRQEAQQVLDRLKRFDTVLAVFNFEEINGTIPAEINEALQKRIQARKDKNWALADSFRDYIVSQGYVIEDTAQGARVKKA